MIRAIFVIGWLGLVLLLVTAVDGYRLPNEEAVQYHLTLSLFPTGALLFADLCVLVYLLGTLRLVRRTAGELGLGADWAEAHRQLVRHGSIWPAAGALLVGSLFASGFAAYTLPWWPRWVHPACTLVTALVQLLFLVLSARALRSGESRLAAFGAAVEAAASGPPRA